MNQYFENNQKLKSELRILKYTYQDYKFNFYSDLGVFSKNKIDEGSRLLVETFFKYGEKNKNILSLPFYHRVNACSGNNFICIR